MYQTHNMGYFTSELTGSFLVHPSTFQTVYLLFAGILLFHSCRPFQQFSHRPIYQIPRGQYKAMLHVIPLYQIIYVWVDIALNKVQSSKFIGKISRKQFAAIKKSATFPSISQLLCRFKLEIVFCISSRLIGIYNCSIFMSTSLSFVLYVWLSSGVDILEKCFTKSSRLTSLLVFFVRLNFLRYFQNLRGDVLLMLESLIFSL